MKATGSQIIRTSTTPGAFRAEQWNPSPSKSREDMHVPRRCWRWATPGIAALVLALVPAAATAQVVIPFISVDSAAIFEGNSGTNVLKLPVHFVVQDPNGGPPIPALNSLTVTGQVSAVPLSSGCIGGATCGGTGVDFEQFVNQPFSIPPNTPNGTLYVGVTVCGDTAIEQDDKIAVFLSNVSGAFCGETCAAIGTILNDDGPPSVSINDISVSHVSGVGTTAKFTVRLNHPSTTSTSIHFATRDGTAKARTTSNIGSYIGTSGTLTIQPNTLTSNVTVSILPLGSGTFFMDLSIPSPTGVAITDGTGQCTIRAINLTVGAFDLSPNNARVHESETINYAVGWTVPPGEVWRNLQTLDFRLRKGNQTALWVHWDEAANTFSVCRKVRTTGKGHHSDDDEEDDDRNAELDCGPEVLPGTLVVLGTPSASLNLAETSVVGSGPTGPSVTLNLPITFGPKAAGHYRVELAAADDLGNQDGFVEAGEVSVVGGRDDKP
jgi:hypothetical protein